MDHKPKRSQTYILNPVAGRRGRRARDALVHNLHKSAPAAEILQTRERGEAQALARARSARPDQVVIAVGGDGTVHEVASGLIGGAAALGVLPTGSGNDFASMIALPADIAKAPAFFAARPVRACDAAAVEWVDAEGREAQGFFVNSLGLGFEGAAAARAERLARLPGFLRYLLAVARELPGYRCSRMRLEFDGAAIDERLFLLAVGSGRRSGGGFVLNPAARIDDGWLDLCWADDLPLHRLLRILPSVFRGGHVRHAGVHTARCRKLLVHCDPPTPVHADGEILTNQAARLSIRILPGALRIAG